MIHAPVVHGALFRIDVRAGDVVVIIDGGYHHTASVRHKEILRLLAHAVSVVGCSSMGALRAVELARYGMIGHGTVFEMYRRGEIDGDDEVAVAHGEGPEYRRTSEPLVNIRHALAAGRRAGVITADAEATVVACARRMPYTARTWRALAHELERDDPGAHAAVVRVREFVDRRRELADIKAQDAVDTLSGLDGLLAPGHHENLSWSLSSGWRHRQLFEWEADFSGCDVSGVWVTFGSVIRYRQLYDDGFPRRWARFALRRVARCDRSSSDDELRAAAVAVAARNGLDGAALTRAQRDAWLLDTEHDLPPEERVRIMLVRSHRPSRGVHDLLTGEPDLVRDEQARQAVAESHVVNSSIAGWAPKQSVEHLKESVLRTHLADAWRLPDADDGRLRAAAQDRGFASVAAAVAAARPFFLRHHVGRVAPVRAQP